MENSKKGKYKFGPITEEDNVITVNFPGAGEIELLITEDCEARMPLLKTGLIPDPRILIPQLQNMEIFDDDIFILAFPKCGTHWVCEMTQMLINGKAEFSPKAKESCMMEFHLPEEYVDLEKPRVFNSHYTPRCLPKAMFDKKCKIIMLQRNPKDILTSLYHHIKNTKLMPNSFTFSEFLRYRMENDGEVQSNLFFYDKVWSECIASTDHPILVLQYEDIKTDTINCLSRLADFIGYPRDEVLLEEIRNKCTVNQMRDAEKRRDSGVELLDSHQVSTLYRKGVIGDWKNHFTVAESEQFDAFIKKYTNKEDLHRYE